MLLGIIIGTFIGAFLGVSLMCLLSTAETDRMRKAVRRYRDGNA